LRKFDQHISHSIILSGTVLFVKRLMPIFFSLSRKSLLRVFAIVLSFCAFVILSVFNPRHTSRHNKEKNPRHNPRSKLLLGVYTAIQVSLVLLLSSGLYVDLASHGLYSCALTSPSPSRIPTYLPTAWPASPQAAAGSRMCRCYAHSTTLLLFRGSIGRSVSCSSAPHWRRPAVWCTTLNSLRPRIHEVLAFE